MKFINKFIGFLSLLIILSSCFKEPDFAFAPSITYQGMTSEIRLDQFIGSTKDSVVVTINFQDGDGDLGLDEEEKAIAQQTDNFNYLIQAYRKINGNFELYEPSVPLSGYYPKLSTDLKPGPIEGTLSYTMEFFHSFTPKSDTLKFIISIKDRSDNLSNEAETEEIVLNQI